MAQRVRPIVLKEEQKKQEIREKINLDFSVPDYNVNRPGAKELRWLYTDASAEIGTPAADIVTFSIESVYAQLAVEDLKRLVAKYKDNSAAMTIIRARVRSYLYNNYVEPSDRSRIASALRLDQSDSQITANKLPNQYRR